MLGVSTGSAAASVVVKSYKESIAPDSVAASYEDIDSPFFAQIFLQEDGPMADRVVDVTKFQNFWFTIILVSGYVALVITTIRSTSVADFLLPGFSQTFVTLLAISHAGYIAGKIPTASQPAAGLRFSQLAAYLTGQSPLPHVAFPRRPPRE